MVSIDGTPKVPMALWPCTSTTNQVGGIVYAGPFTGSSNVNTETCLSLPATIDPGVPLLVGSTSAKQPQWGGTNVSTPIRLNLQNWASVTEVANDTSTGTVASSLAKDFFDWRLRSRKQRHRGAHVRCRHGRWQDG